LWEQNETGLEREFSEDFRPAILWGLGWLGDDPELALGMMNEGHSMPSGGTDGPTPTEEINLVVRVDASSQVEGEMEVQQAGIRTGTQDGALFLLRLGAGVVRGKAGGAADGAILAGQFAIQQFLCGDVSGDFFVGQKGDDAFLEGAKTAFDFAFGLRAGRDQMRDPQRGERALELRARIAAIARGLVAKQGQAIGIKSYGQAVMGKGAAEVLEVVPGGVGRNKAGSQEFARVVIDGQQEGLLIDGRPPLVDGRVVLPQFAQASPFPAAAGPGSGPERADQQREVTAGVGGDGFAVALESEAGGQFIGDELIVGRPLEGQEGLQELLNLGGPDNAMVAAREVEGKGGRLSKPSGSQAKEVSTTNAQELSGGVRVEVATVESIERLVEEL